MRTGRLGIEMVDLLTFKDYWDFLKEMESIRDNLYDPFFLVGLVVSKVLSIFLILPFIIFAETYEFIMRRLKRWNRI